MFRVDKGQKMIHIFYKPHSDSLRKTTTATLHSQFGQVKWTLFKPKYGRDKYPIVGTYLLTYIVCNRVLPILNV